ncbi:hypothetical protein SLITK23_17770 [Streptomyces lividans]|nr:hypothetical protein SLITK23_17770 [Streptomyces lividans]
MARAPDMDTTGVAAAREDAGPLDGPLRVARRADRPGHREVWLGEGPTWDAFVLAAAAGAGTRRIALTAGPDRRPGHRTGPDGCLRRDGPGWTPTPRQARTSRPRYRRRRAARAANGP